MKPTTRAKRIAAAIDLNPDEVHYLTGWNAKRGAGWYLCNDYGQPLRWLGWSVENAIERAHYRAEV